MSKRITVEVTLWIDDDADAHDVVADCDYTFNHDAIEDTEITGLIDEHNQTIFHE